MDGKKVTLKAIRSLVLWLTSISMIIPIALILLNSLKSKGEALKMSFSWPESFHWENYSTVIERGNLAMSFLNSLTYSIAATVLVVILASMAAFVLSRNRSRINRRIYMFLVLGITLSLNHIALMKIMEWTHLLNTRLGMIFIYAAMQIPFAVFLIFGFVSTVPRDLDEATFLDGAGALRLFISIIFPLMKPALVTVGLLCFLNSWNEFVLPLYYLNDSSLWPMTNSIYMFFGRYSASWNLVSANMILTCLPVVILFLLGQKYLLSGITAGAVKG